MNGCKLSPRSWGKKGIKREFLIVVGDGRCMYISLMPELHIITSKDNTGL